MFYRENFGVVLPKQDMPWILDGKEQPKSVKKVFVTPYGTFPRMADITAIYGRSKREVEDRRMRRDTPKFKSWYVITKPTVEDAAKAIAFVNAKYVEINEVRDNCQYCNGLDELLFSEDCWLIDSTHTCGTDGQKLYEVMITYSFQGVEYTTSVLSWLQDFGIKGWIQEHCLSRVKGTILGGIRV